MLPDRLSQLLTAYIDGELSGRQRRAVARLLRKSAEARSMLRELEGDSQILRSLPRVRLEHDLSKQVVKTIAERRMQVRRRLAVVQPAFPIWTGYAAAAAVLFVVFCGTYLYFYALAHEVRPAAGLIADNQPQPDDDTPPEFPPAVAQVPPQPPSSVQPRPPAPAEVAVKEPRKPEPFVGPEVPPEVAPANTTLAKPSPRLEVFEVVNQKVAVSLALRDLDKDKNKLQLRQELQPDDAYRLELFSLGRSRAFERLQTILKAQGFNLLIDPLTAKRLKNPGWKTDYVLYLEGLAPEEFAKILEQLGTDEKKSKDVQFGDVLLLEPLTETDHKELSKLLGVDPTKLDPPKRGPLGVDIRKPLSQTTAQQLQQALAGQGTPRPESGKQPAVKGPQRQALVLAYNPVRPSPSAREIKLFLDGRAERRPGTIQVLLVLRGANG